MQSKSCGTMQRQNGCQYSEVRQLPLFLTVAAVLMGAAVTAQAQSSSWLHTGRATWPQPPDHQAPSVIPQAETVPAPRFRLIPIGAVPGRTSTFVSLSRSVNNKGAVAGWSYNPGRRFLTAIPFVWRRGTFQLLPLPSGSPGAFAFGINDRDQVVGAGNHLDSTGQQLTQSAVVWQSGKVTDLSGLFDNTLSSFAADINNKGALVGAYVTADTQTEVPFVLHSGRLTVLPIDPSLAAMGLSQAEPGRINDFSEIAGEQFNAAGTASVPVLWQWDGEHYKVRSLGDLGGTFGQAVGINELGLVVGWSNLSGDASSRPFVWRGRLRALGVLPGDTDSRAFDINDHGQIVGLSANEMTTRTFLWERGKMRDLNALVPAAAPPFNDNVGQINDRGQLAVVSVDPTGTESAFLLVPLKQD